MLDPPGMRSAGTAEPDSSAPLPFELDSTSALGPAAAVPAVTTRDRIVSLIEVAACSGFPTQVTVVLALSAVGLPALTDSGQLSLTYIAWLSVIDAVLLVGLCLAFLWARGERPRDVLLGVRRPAVETLAGVLLVPIAFALVITAGLVIERVAPWLRNPGGNPLEALLENPAHLALFAGVAVLAGGIREEVQRAFVLHRFDRHLGGATLGLVLFSIVFGLGHVIQGWDATILTGILGVFWGSVYLRRRSIVAPAVCHALFNVIEIVYHGLVA